MEFACPVGYGRDGAPTAELPANWEATTTPEGEGHDALGLAVES